MVNYIDNSVKRYLDDLAAKLPAPGGGSASALVATTGVALLSMVTNFTVNKKGYESYQDEIKKILIELDTALKRLYKLIDIDVTVYEKVSNTYKLLKNTDEEKTYREQQIQNVLKEAVEVPYEIIDICQKMVNIASRLVKIGNKNLISDIGCGTVFLISAIKGAKFNIDINLKYITDKDFVRNKKTLVESIILESRKIADSIVADTMKELTL